MKTGLCYRCEYRALFFEENYGARSECQHGGAAVGSCYMFKPVAPIVIKKRKDDKRPALGPWAISARMERVQVDPRLECVIKKTKKGLMPYWRPKA